jgi:hypothetical protein
VTAVANEKNGIVAFAGLANLIPSIIQLGLTVVDWNGNGVEQLMRTVYILMITKLVYWVGVLREEGEGTLIYPVDTHCLESIIRIERIIKILLLFEYRLVE